MLRMPVDYLYWLNQIQQTDRDVVGDKAFYLGLLLQQGYPVVPGVVVSTVALQEFLERIDWQSPMLADLPHSSLHVDVDQSQQLQTVARQIRQAILSTPIPQEWLAQIETAVAAWQSSALIFRPSFTLSAVTDPTVNHRTAGLLEAHVCPMQPEAIATGLKQIWAEIFRARTLLYWQRLGIQLQQIHLAVLIQPIETAIASGDVHISDHYIDIHATWGLGHAFVKGEVTPDHYHVHAHTGSYTLVLGNKPYTYSLLTATDSQCLLGQVQSCYARNLTPPPQQNQAALTDAQLQSMIQLVQQMKTDLGMALNLEWTLQQKSEGSPPEFWITQATPQLALSLTTSTESNRASGTFVEETHASRLAGLPASPGIASASAWVVSGTEQAIAEIPADVILVTSQITPTQLVALSRIAGIVTEQGGFTSHGAILAREMGIPAVVGVSNATHRIQNGEPLIIDGDQGRVYLESIDSGSLPGTVPERSEAYYAGTARNPAAAKYSSQSTAASRQSASRQSLSSAGQSTGFGAAQEKMTQLFVTLSQPESIAAAARLPVDGVGLLRSELLLLNVLNRQLLEEGWQLEQHPILIDRIAEPIQRCAASFAPRPVFYRSHDLRSHEFPTLTPAQILETNPMLGIRGTLSYQIHPELFKAELAALRQVHQQGYPHVHLLLPFVRTVEEFLFCQQLVEQAELRQNPHFQLWIMAEVPSVLLLLADYVKAGVQGIAIGSNDLTQLLLGVDRDHPQMAGAFDQSHPAVMQAIQHLIQMAQQLGIPCSLCGDAPTRYPDMIDALVRWGITAISVDMGEIERIHDAIARVERRLLIETMRHDSE